MQGLQVLTTVDDAWGGFAASYLNNLRDEYPKTTIWAWALERSAKTTRGRVLSRAAASIQSLIGMLPSCTTYIPINIPRPSLKLPTYVKGYEPTSSWRTSALIAAALETSILPSRLKAAGSRRTLAEVSTLLNANGNQQISTLRLNALSENPEKIKDADPIGFFSDPVDFSWGGAEKHIFAGLEVLRGIEKSHDTSQKPDRTIKDSRESQCYSDLRFPMLSSFPDIFEQQKNPDKSLNLGAALRTSSSVVEHLKASQLLANRIIPVDERETITNGLGELYEAYEEGWGSDSDDFYD